MAYVPGRIFIAIVVVVIATSGLFALSAFAQPAGDGTTISVSTTRDVVADDGLCALREAITSANTDAAVYPGAGECSAGNGADTILLTTGVYGIQIQDFDIKDENDNFSGDFDIRGDLTIRGISVDDVRVSARERDRVFHIHPASEVHLETLRVSDGRTPDGQIGAPGGNGENGGGIFNEGNLHLVGVVVEDNHTGNGGDASDEYTWGGRGGDGGGIYTLDGTLSLTDSKVLNNRSGDAGYGPSYQSADGAGSGGDGAGIFNQGSTISLWNSTISNNRGGHGQNSSSPPYATYFSVGGQGGGLFNRSGYVLIRYSEISYNSSGDGGMNDEQTYIGNGATGGGLFNVDRMLIDHSLIQSNTTGYGYDTGDGGGIYTSGALTITDSNISHNTVNDGYMYGGNGGGISIAPPGPVSILRSAILDNYVGVGLYSGAEGGGIYSIGTVTVTASTIANNVLENNFYRSWGGGVINNAFRLPFVIRDSTIVNNVSEWAAGVVNANEGDIYLRNSIVANDNASQWRDCFGFIHSEGYLLIKEQDESICTITGDMTGVQIGVDPLLGGLVTPMGDLPYFPLLPESPALDTGDCAASATDTLNRPRPVDMPNTLNISDGCDIGASETQLIDVSPHTVFVAENGFTDTYTLSLAYTPTAPVTITLSTGGQVTVSPSVVLFPSDGWTLPHTITVQAPGDDIPEGLHADTIRHSATSTDPVFADAPIADVSVVIKDTPPNTPPIPSATPTITATPHPNPSATSTPTNLPATYTPYPTQTPLATYTPVVYPTVTLYPTYTPIPPATNALYLPLLQR